MSLCSPIPYEVTHLVPMLFHTSLGAVGEGLIRDSSQPQTSSIQLESSLLRFHSKYCQHHALSSAVVLLQDSREYWFGSFLAQNLVPELRLAARPAAVDLRMPQVRNRKTTPMAIPSLTLIRMLFVSADWKGSGTATVVATVEIAVGVGFAVAVLLRVLPWVSQEVAVGYTLVVWMKKLK